MSVESELEAYELASRVLQDSVPQILKMARTTEAESFLSHVLCGLTSILVYECGKASGERALALCADALAANAHDLVPGGLH